MSYSACRSTDQPSTKDQYMKHPLKRSLTITVAAIAITASGTTAAQANRCAKVRSAPTRITISLSGSWSTLLARSSPFQGCSVRDEMSTGDALRATRETNNGQTICVSPFGHNKGGSKLASSVWYKTRIGWVWSGGTNRPVWNHTCGQ